MVGVGDAFAVVSDDVSISEVEMRALPPPHPSPAALRCEGGGRTAGDWAAVGVWSMVMAGGSASLFDESKASFPTERLPPSQDAPAFAAGEDWGGGSDDDVSADALSSTVRLPPPVGDWDSSRVVRESWGGVTGGSHGGVVSAVSQVGYSYPMFSVSAINGRPTSVDESVSVIVVSSLPPPHPSPAAGAGAPCEGGGNSNDVSASVVCGRTPPPSPPPQGEGGRAAEDGAAVGV